MPNLEWAHALAALIGAFVAAVGGIFASGWRLGRMEERFKREITSSESRLEVRIREAHMPFDETLKGLRQKINDVELDAEKRFLLKDDFNDFRDEYRDDMRDLKALIAGKKQ